MQGFVCAEGLEFISLIDDYLLLSFFIFLATAGIFIKTLYTKALGAYYSRS